MDGTTLKGDSAYSPSVSNNKEATILNIEDLDTAAKMLDRLARVSSERRKRPLSRFDYIPYDHRTYCDQYNLQIGDTWFMIPPEFIMVSSESQTGKIVTLRQENTQKAKSGYHRRTILIDLVVHGSDQINGFKVEAPGGYYYVDGLRPLLAQFKRTPFLPIFNELINTGYGIWSVALQSITIQTVENFPNVMTAQITLQEVNMMPYIEMHSYAYQFLIDWDLMRFYYQNAMTELHEYKKLQSIPVNKEKNHLIMRSLDVDVFNNYSLEHDTDKSKFLRIITDKSNYDTWIDSSEDNFHIVSFSCNYSNMLANVQMSEADSPTVQFMGGMDTIYNIVIETTDKLLISKMEQGRINNDLLTRENPKLRSLGFVMLESELVELTGSLFVMIDNISTNTVPGFPGLFNIQITCVAYDIGQSEREQLNGFLPFDKAAFDASIEVELNENANLSNFSGSTFYPDGYDYVVAIQNKYQAEYEAKKKELEDTGKTAELNQLKEPGKIENYTYFKVCGAVQIVNNFPPETDDNVWHKMPNVVFGGPASPNSGNYSYVQAYQDDKTGTVVYYDSIDHLLYVQRNSSGTGVQDSSVVLESIVGEVKEGTYSDRYKKAQCITQDEDGLHTKITQDLYAEHQIRTKMEVYPDLHLPTYEEVNQHITKIIAFRNKNGLSEYPLTTYPVQPFNALYGCSDTLDGLGDAFHPSDIQVPSATYKGYVDPDFYVFYISYEDLKKDIEDEEPELIKRSSSTRSRIVNANTSAITSAYLGNSPIDPENIPVGLVNAALAIIGDNETANKYGTVNPDDNGACSIGKYQFHANRARDLLANIIKSSPSEAEQYLGPTLIAEIQNGSNWSTRKLTDIEKTHISDLLKTETGKKAQDDQAFIDISGIISNGIKAGLTDTNALIFYADCAHQYGEGGARDVLTNAINGYNGNPKNSLESAYQYSLTKENGLRNDRRNTVYNKLISSNANALANALDSTTSTVYVISETDKYNMTHAAYWLLQGDLEPYQNNLYNVQLTIAQCFFDNYVNGCGTVEATSSPFMVGLGGYAEIGPFFLGVSKDLIPDEDSQNQYDAFEESMFKAIDAVFCNKQKAPGCENYTLHVMANAQYQDQTYHDDCITQKDNFRNTRCLGNHTCNDALIRITGASYAGAFEVYGCEEPSRDDVAFVQDTDIDEFNNTLAASGAVKTTNYNVMSLSSADIKYFGEPLIAKTKRLNEDQDFVVNTANSYSNIYNSCFTDMYQFSGRGRLVRAFPAFLFCILDDQAQWYDGRKLWTNYYVYQSVTDIQVHQTNDMPTDTAVITITNSVNNLGKAQAGLSGYTVSSDSAYLKNGFSKWFYKTTGMIIGGIKITDKIIELHQILYDHARLREGARIHLRMGYGSDPFSLAPMINGHISDITIGDQITMVVTSDGHELLQTVMSTKTDVNNGIFGLFGLGATQEASNIIAKMMVARSSWMNYLFRNWYESSKYSLEHFGLYFHNYPLSIDGGWSAIQDIWNEAKEHWDILMNVYVANYRRELYCPGTPLWFFDGEQNFTFNKYNMVPWDVGQLCAQQAPEYIIKAMRHQFDSRLFFGLPFYMERYRYDFFGGNPETNTKTTTKVTTNPAAVSYTGNKDGSGHFTLTEYDSDKQPTDPPKDAKMKECIFQLQLKGHSLTSKEEKNDPDVMRIYGYTSSGQQVLLATSLKDDPKGTPRQATNIKIKDFESQMRTLRVSGEYLSDIERVEFVAHCQHENCCKNNAECIDWEIIYENTTDEPEIIEEEITVQEELKYDDILYEELKSAAQAHYLDSMTNIIDNQVRVTNKFSNTNVKCMYVLGKKTVSTVLLKSDDTIDAAYQKTAIVDTPIVQDAFGIDALWEATFYKVGKNAAKRVGISNLLYGWQQQYQGQILLFGSPGIKPHDYLMVNDVFSNLYGLSICREVIHSFNSSSGYTTSVTPGMIGFDTQENSMCIPHCQNLLVTLNAFSILTTTRLSQVHTIESFISEVSAQCDLLNKACLLMQQEKERDFAMATLKEVTDLAEMAFVLIRIITTAKKAESIVAYIGQILSAVKAGFEGLTTATSLLQGAGILANGVGLAGNRAAGALLGFGPHGWIVLAALFAIEQMINAVVEYFANRNCVILMPMLWENYPFVSGVKDGEKILLIPSNPNGTNENTKGQGNYNATSYKTNSKITPKDQEIDVDMED